ncbi:MAG: HPr kinase/phosphatase C-terminal domain-containing protein, partial [Xanthobacteraceae bacterium]
PRAVLIRGGSGAGKSRLAFELLEAGRAGALPFARLVGDDRVQLESAGGRLVVRPAAPLAGLIELRGVGIMRLPCEPAAVVGLVVDLGAAGERLPDEQQQSTELHGIRLPRLAVAAGQAALPAILALLTFCSESFVRRQSGTGGIIGTSGPILTFASGFDRLV